MENESIGNIWAKVKKAFLNRNSNPEEIEYANKGIISFVTV